MSKKQVNKKGLKNNGIKVGDWVVFRAKKGKCLGIISQISSEATILVESEKGEVFNHEKRYLEQNVPILMLRKIGKNERPQMLLKNQRVFREVVLLLREYDVDLRALPDYYHLGSTRQPEAIIYYSNRQVVFFRITEQGISYNFKIECPSKDIADELLSRLGDLGFKCF